MRQRLSIPSLLERAGILTQIIAKFFRQRLGTFSEERRVWVQILVVNIVDGVRPLTIPKIANSFQKKFAI